MPGVLVTPVPASADWQATVAPNASPVVISAVAPGVVSSGELAILGVLLFGFGLVVILLAYILLRRHMA